MRKRKSPRPHEIKLDRDAFGNLRNCDLAIVRVVCPDRAFSMNLLLKSQEEDALEKEIPIVNESIKWKRLERLLEHGTMFVFSNRGHTLAFSLVNIAKDSLFSTRGPIGCSSKEPMEETIMKNIN